QALLSVGETFTEGWLMRLTPQARRRVASRWETKVSTSATEVAWQFGVIAARFGETEAALRLLEMPCPPKVDSDIAVERDSLLATLKHDGDYFVRTAQRLVSSSAAASDTHAWIIAGLAVLAALANGLVTLDAQLLQILVKRLADGIRRHESPLLDAQL